MRTALLLPYSSSPNPYMDILRGEIERLGFLAEPLTFGRFFGSVRKLFNSRNVVVLNWIENAAFRSKNGKLQISIGGFLKVAGLLILLCLARARIVYFVHNHAVHDTSGGAHAFSRHLIATFRRIADVRAVHDPTFSEIYDAIYVPHPLYSEFREDVGFDRSACEDDQGSFGYTIVGTIRRYKRIEDVLLHWPPSTRLLIAGAADEAYLAELKLIIASRGLEHVTILSRPLATNELVDIVRRSEGVLIPHMPDSALVSGAIFEALSYSVPVFVRRSPFSEWASLRIPYCVRVFNDLQEFSAGSLEVRRECCKASEPKIRELFGRAAYSSRIQELLRGDV